MRANWNQQNLISVAIFRDYLDTMIVIQNKQCNNLQDSSLTGNNCCKYFVHNRRLKPNVIYQLLVIILLKSTFLAKKNVEVVYLSCICLTELRFWTVKDLNY